MPPCYAVISPDYFCRAPRYCRYAAVLPLDAAISRTLFRYALFRFILCHYADARFANMAHFADITPFLRHAALRAHFR